MVPDLTDVCGAAVAEVVADEGVAVFEAALVDMVHELKREDCTRENILGAAGVLGWAVGFHAGAADGGKAAAELTKRAALLTLIACYSGGLPRRDRSYVYERLRLKAEIRENAGAIAESAGVLDVAAIHYERACTLRAQAIAMQHL